MALNVVGDLVELLASLLPCVSCVSKTYRIMGSPTKSKRCCASVMMRRSALDPYEIAIVLILEGQATLAHEAGDDCGSRGTLRFAPRPVLCSFTCIRGTSHLGMIETLDWRKGGSPDML